MSYRKAALFVAVTVISISGRADSQDGSEVSAARTPESAQRFLGELTQQGVLRLYQGLVERDGRLMQYRMNESWPIRDNKVLGDTFYGVAESWSATGRCTSSITVTAPQSVNASSIYHQSPPPSMNLTVDWTKVIDTTFKGPSDWPIPSTNAGLRNVKFYEAGVVVRDGVQVAPLFVFERKEDAERAHFAFDFLRRECELKSDTGF